MGKISYSNHFSGAGGEKLLKTWTIAVCIALVLLGAVLFVGQQSVSAGAEKLPEVTTIPTESVAETVPEQTMETISEDETEPAAETVPAEVPEPTAAVTATEATEAPEPTEPAAETVPVEEVTEVPLYFQTDYPNNLYGGGTIADNGCSVTCLAMVATYLTDHEYLPNELARYFGGVAENNIERLEKGAEAMQLPWEKMQNFHKAMEALRKGKVVIALMDGSSIFTETQHFIVLTGFNEDGLIMVNDPHEPNYEKWDLKRAFQEGFTEGDICFGFSGAWAFDKSAMPEEPFLYYEESLGDQSRYGDLQLTHEELRLLASVIWVEARGESEEGQQAVAEVILNRLASDAFADTLNGVIYAEGQFRSAGFLDEAEPHQAQYEAIDRAIHGPYILPTDVVHFATFRTNNNVWGQIGGHIFCYQD